MFCRMGWADRENKTGEICSYAGAIRCYLGGVTLEWIRRQRADATCWEWLWKFASSVYWLQLVLRLPPLKMDIALDLAVVCILV